MTGGDHINGYKKKLYHITYNTGRVIYIYSYKGECELNHDLLYWYGIPKLIKKESISEVGGIRMINKHFTNLYKDLYIYVEPNDILDIVEKRIVSLCMDYIGHNEQKVPMGEYFEIIEHEKRKYESDTIVKILEAYGEEPPPLMFLKYII